MTHQGISQQQRFRVRQLELSCRIERHRTDLSQLCLVKFHRCGLSAEKALDLLESEIYPRFRKCLSELFRKIQGDVAGSGKHRRGHQSGCLCDPKAKELITPTAGRFCSLWV